MSTNLLYGHEATAFSRGVESTDETDADYYSDGSEESEYSVSAQRQWEESIQQITGLVHFVLFPLVGKLLGRRAAHVLWRHVANWWFPQ